MDYLELRRLQVLSLDEKITRSKEKVVEYYEILNGHVYVSISGGKDSTVLLHLVRSVYPNVKAMFLDTGLEHPENRAFVKTLQNVEWVKPDKNFSQVLQEEGYPIPSKEQARFIKEYQTTKSIYLKRVRLEGKPLTFEKRYKKYLLKYPTTKREEYYQIFREKYPQELLDMNKRCKISKRWQFLANSKYKISDKCCDILKKNPAKRFDKKFGLFPITGEMAVDSTSRRRLYLKNGCNALSSGKIKSTPLGFWTEKNIWEYIKKFNLSYSDAYKHGLERTGCMFCLFGVAEDSICRFKIIKQFHPNLYDYCMNKLGIKELLEFLKTNNIVIDYE